MSMRGEELKELLLIWEACEPKTARFVTHEYFQVTPRGGRDQIGIRVDNTNPSDWDKFLHTVIDFAMFYRGCFWLIEMGDSKEEYAFTVCDQIVTHKGRSSASKGLAAIDAYVGYLHKQFAPGVLYKAN